MPPYGILPPLLILSIERKQLHDESVNLRKCQHLTLRVLDRHRNQRDQAGRKDARMSFLGLDGISGLAVDLFPFYRQINSSSWEGGLSLLNRQKVFLSANLIVAPRRNFFAYSCPPNSWLTEIALQKVVWGRLMCTLCYCATGTCSLGSMERGPL